MPQFTIHTIDNAPEGARDSLRTAKQRFGFLPNLLGELAVAPAALKGYVTLSQLVGESSLSPVEQNLVLAATSVANECHYCVAAHTAGLKQAGLGQDQIDAVREGRALSDARLEALRGFTTTVVEKRGHVEDSDLERFLDAGYRRAQVFEVILGVAMKTLSNYTNHIADTPLDKELASFAWEPATA